MLIYINTHHDTRYPIKDDEHWWGILDYKGGIMRKLIKKWVLDAMYAILLEDKSKNEAFISSFFYSYDRLNKVQSALEELVIKYVDEKLKKEVAWKNIDIRDGAIEAVKEYLGEEDMIDELVEKLNRKQLREG